MLKILMIVLIFIIFFAVEASKLVRKREIKELAVFSFLMIIGLALSLFMIVRSFV